MRKEIVQIQNIKTEKKKRFLTYLNWAKKNNYKPKHIFDREIYELGLEKMLSKLKVRE